MLCLLNKLLFGWKTIKINISSVVRSDFIYEFGPVLDSKKGSFYVEYL